jgi:hypothetical protein
VWLKKSIKGAGKRVDKKALVSAVGLMLISWAALPIVYWLIVRRKKASIGEAGAKENDKVIVKVEEVENNGNMDET